MADLTEPNSKNNGASPTVSCASPSREVSVCSPQISTPCYTQSPVSSHGNRGSHSFSTGRMTYRKGIRSPNGLYQGTRSPMGSLFQRASRSVDGLGLQNASQFLDGHNLSHEYNGVDEPFNFHEERNMHDAELHADSLRNDLDTVDKRESVGKTTAECSPFDREDCRQRPHVFGQAQHQGTNGHGQFWSYGRYQGYPNDSLPYPEQDPYLNYDAIRSQRKRKRRISVDEEPNASGVKKAEEEKKSTDKNTKEKKSITTKTFAHGMMDVSLMTSNASQLRSLMSDPDHDFYNLLLYLLTASIVLQILSGVILIVSDFYKTQVKEKDLQNHQKRKLFNFVALAIVMVITSLNILITAFYSPAAGSGRRMEYMPQFVSGSLHGPTNHTEL